MSNHNKGDFLARNPRSQTSGSHLTPDEGMVIDQNSTSVGILVIDADSLECSCRRAAERSVLAISPSNIRNGAR
jgi:hypothetical protein